MDTIRWYLQPHQREKAGPPKKKTKKKEKEQNRREEERKERKRGRNGGIEGDKQAAHRTQPMHMRHGRPPARHRPHLLLVLLFSKVFVVFFFFLFLISLLHTGYGGGARAG